MNLEQIKNAIAKLELLHNDIKCIEEAAGYFSNNSCEVNFSLSVIIPCESSNNSEATLEISEALHRMFGTTPSYEQFERPKKVKGNLGKLQGTMNETEALEVLGILLRIKLEKKKAIIQKLTRIGITV